MSVACGVEAASGSPGPEYRVVEFRACKNIDVIKSRCNKDLAVGQQGRRVIIVCGAEAGCESPGPARWGVEAQDRIFPVGGVLVGKASVPFWGHR